MDLLLTTFPAHKSQNVGDNLITHSLYKLIKARKPAFDPVKVYREESLDGFSKKKVKSVIAPGMTVCRGAYPHYFGLYTDLTRLTNFFPVGCSFQHIMPDISSFRDYRYDDATLSFLRMVADMSGPLPCRDALIVEMLHRYNIPAVYSGDMAIFDEDYLDTAFSPPREIQSVVFTIQHHIKYIEQSIDLLKRIRRQFPDAKRYIAYHSTPGPIPRTIGARAKELGYEELHQYGDVENLERYNDIDLHIGYRLHGHICFLRKRKPSVLLVEDARSYGFASTPGTDVGCISAFDYEHREPRDEAPEEAMAFVTEQIRRHFSAYFPLFDFIDGQFNDYLSGYLDHLVSCLHTEEAAAS